MDISKVTMKSYLNPSFTLRKALAKEIGSMAENLFHVNNDSRGIIASHRLFDFRFRFVPGGNYQIGFSSKEENAARRIKDPFPANIEEMRPVIKINISPILVSESPITNKLAGHFNLNCNDSDHFPARLTKEEGDQIAKKFGCRLPNEGEWEVACRAGNDTLFSFGNDLPSEHELEKWLNWDLSKPMELPANAIGLVGLYFGEWCSDYYRPSYDISSQKKGGIYVIRGGGAFFWPWQDDEWVWCMSAMRMPSTDLLEDGRCSCRLVYDLL